MKPSSTTLKLVFSSLLAAALALGSAAALAQQAAPKAAQAPAKPAKPASEQQKKGPAKIDLPSPDEKDVSKDALADQKRDEAIKMLKEILARFQPGPRKADVMFQLAELYWEKSKYLYFKEMHNFEDAVEDCQKREKDLRKCDEMKISTRESDLYRKQALEIYQKIIKDYPDYPRKDEVLFVLAYNLYEMGNKTDGIKYYWDLIKQFPKSKWAPDAYLALGEHFFNSNEVFKAVQAYQKALGYTDSKIYVFALYKLAWCDYNLGEYDKGIEKLKKVVEIAEKEQSKTGEKARIQLKREAINDLALFFTMVDAVEEARDYFVNAGGKDVEQEQLRRMAKLYEEQGKDDQAVKTYKLLISEFPYAPENPEYQSAIVQAYKRIGNKAAVYKESRSLVELYRPDSPWGKANALNQKALATAQEITESNLRDIVMEYHQEAQKTKDVKTYQVARDLYREYLDNFPKSESAYKMRYYYAEILWALEDYEKAAEQYDGVVASNPKGEFSVKAAYNSVLALEKTVEFEKKGELHKALDKGKVDEAKSKGAVKRDVKLEKMDKAKSLAAKQIPKYEKMLADACDRFTQLAPQHEEFFAVKFKAAHIYYKYNHLHEASKRFGEFIERYPDNKYALSAADLILDSYNVKEDWKSIHYWAKKFLAIKPLAGQPDPAEKGQPYSKHLQEILEGAQFKIAMETMAEGNKQDAATEFRAFVVDFPNSKYGQKALYNAMVMYADLKKLDLAIETGNLFLSKYASESAPAAAGQKKASLAAAVKAPAKKVEPGKAEEAKKETEPDPLERTIYLMGTYYDKIADFKNAADFFERYYAKYPKGKDAEDAIYNAALFRDALGQYDRAIEDYNTYMRDFPAAKDISEVWFKIAAIHQKAGQWSMVKNDYQNFLDKNSKNPAMLPRVIETRFNLAGVLRKLGQESAADKELAEIVKISDTLKKEDANEKLFYMIAYSKFMLLEPDFREYQAIKLSASQRLLKENLKQKSDKLLKLEKQYTEILQTGQGDVGIAALCRIGQLYQNYARTLLDAPVPKNLDADQRDIYMAELQNLAFPVEEKAIEAFEKTLAKSYELGIYNEWTITAQENLNKYKPGTYPDLPQTRYAAKEYFYTPAFLASLKAPAAPAPAAQPQKAPEPKAAPELKGAAPDQKKN